MKGNAPLLEDARKGDEKAIHELIVRYQVDIQRMARSQCANFSDAEDAAQESLLVMYRKIGTLRTLKAFPGWIFTIVRHECHKLMRSRRNWVVMDDANTPEEPSTYDSLDKNFDIVAAIGALSEIDRQLIIQCHIERRQVSECASLLGISKAAAKSRLQRARLVLRRRLHVYSHPTSG